MLGVIPGDVLKAAVRWVAIPAWILAVCAVITVLGHGCVSCVKWTDEGCTQRYDSGIFIIEKDEFGPHDRVVAVAKSPREAWVDASAECPVPEMYQ